jgi:hypothetical protein
MAAKTKRRAGNNFALLPEPGPGLKIRGTKTDPPWYGQGCGVCGNQDPDGQYSPLIPVRVLYWDPDDGWRSGVLCQGCAEEAAERGPQPDDYAEHMRREREAKDAEGLNQIERLTILEEIHGSDQDAIQVDSEDQAP